MCSASLLLLMTLLLPHAVSGHLAAAVVRDGLRAPPDPSSAQTPPAPAQAPPGPAHTLPGLAQTLPRLLLRRLGLQEPPAPQPSAAVPQYLLDLYRFHSQQLHLIQDPHFSLPSQHLQGANTVRSFHHTESTDLLSPASGRVRLVFNVSYLPEDENLLSAELRFIHLGPASHTVSLYLSQPHWEVQPTLLESRPITGKGAWQAFPIGGALLAAATQRGSLNFDLEVTPTNGSRPQEGEGHLRVRRSAGQDEHSWVRERPLLVIYSHDGRSEPLLPLLGPSSGRGRGRRGRRGRKEGGKSGRGGARGWEWGDRRVKRNGGRAAKLKRLSRARCRRHPLYVDFKDVGWDKWIVAPTGYHAFFCLGECRFPLADHMNSSSHAMVQTLVNSVNGAVPRACCVPTALSPIAMLYLDQQERVVLKNYQDMVVEGCGCR